MKHLASGIERRPSLEQLCRPHLPSSLEDNWRRREERRNVGGLTCLMKVIETMSQETMPWSMSSKKAVRVNASISL